MSCGANQQQEKTNAALTCLDAHVPSEKTQKKCMENPPEKTDV